MTVEGPRDATPTRSPALPLAGLIALLIGLGFGRFAYTALVPALIDEGWATVTTAGYLASANFAGYLLGALGSGRVAALAPLPAVIRSALAVTVLAFVASAVDLGPVWLAVWRFVPGFAGALLMVLVPMAILAGLPPVRRPRAVGLIFTGIGLGIAFTGLLVPSLARLGVGTAWLVLAVVSALLAAATWRVWGRLAPSPVSESRTAAALPAVPRLALLLLFLAYALDAAGFVPHTVYWVDFIARELDLGYGVGGTQWVLFGLGAMAGPIVVGQLAHRIGFGPALVTAMAVKAGAVLLPVVDTSFPALCVSSVVVGALTPGTATLAAGSVAELAGAGRQRASWGLMTSGFAATQAGSASIYATVLGATHSYALLFEAGGMLLILGAILAFGSGRFRR